MLAEPRVLVLPPILRSLPPAFRNRVCTHAITTFVILTSYCVLSKIRAYRAATEFFDCRLAAQTDDNKPAAEGPRIL